MKPTSTPLSAKAAAGVLPLALALALAAAEVEPKTYEHIIIPSGEHQLFLDDFLLGALHRVKRRIHQPAKYDGNLVLRGDQPWEGVSIQTRSAPCWDPDEKVWKLWYFGAGPRTGFARSKDGIHWEKPVLGKRDFEGSRENNMVVIKGDPGGFIQHVVIDPDAPPARRYKGMQGSSGRKPLVSADGYEFEHLDVPTVPSQDESHLNYDEVHKRFILTLKQRGPFGRSVYLSLSRNFEQWTRPELIFHADARDQELGRKRMREHFANSRLYTPYFNAPEEYNTEIYNMPVFPYEGIYIGMPNFFESSGRTPMPHNNQDGVNSVKLATSRDLRRWTKVGNRDSFIPVSELGAGRIDTVQIFAASRPIVRGDELWFYYTGINQRYSPDGKYLFSPDGKAQGGIHLAKLRRDGFVSFYADEQSGFVETRAIRFDGKRLFVNADARGGELRAEVVNARGREVLATWDRSEAAAVTGDHLRTELTWQNHEGVEALRGTTVRFRFHLNDAHLYSFWIEP